MSTWAEVAKSNPPYRRSGGCLTGVGGLRSPRKDFNPVINPATDSCASRERRRDLYRQGPGSPRTGWSAPRHGDPDRTPSS